MQLYLNDTYLCAIFEHVPMCVCLGHPARCTRGGWSPWVPQSVSKTGLGLSDLRTVPTLASHRRGPHGPRQPTCTKSEYFISIKRSLLLKK